MKKILHLTLKRKWFDLIASGKKKVEYREGKEYWRKRLLGKDGMAIGFDEVHFRNGYDPEVPFMRVEWKNLGQWRFSDGSDDYILLGDHGEEIRCGFFEIFLGKVLEV